MSSATPSVAIVTGASQGIGRATAIRLAADFSTLVLVARDGANLSETAQAVRSQGAQALVIEADLSKPAVPGSQIARCPPADTGAWGELKKSHGAVVFMWGNSWTAARSNRSDQLSGGMFSCTSAAIPAVSAPSSGYDFDHSTEPSSDSMTFTSRFVLSAIPYTT
jgi:hypothetical protein